MDGQDVCLRLDISPRTLQTLRDTGRLAFTCLQSKFYYKPEDVEKLMAYVGIRRKEKAMREGRKNGNL
ncbi:helix-turn-helix domain-containing protein [Bacteroides fragilis]|uniref:helix-turn-helix domain-containing protein n=1 Tax=Bacteroides fragilis TaxID=817 RepID=UPI003313A912|nr:helix-turn-helix domain-containing protein [Bacteroides fragilis]